jgi:hypothetical protein
MKASAEFYAVDTVAANETTPGRLWVAGLLLSSLVSWVLVIGAARLIAALV